MLLLAGIGLLDDEQLVDPLVESALIYDSNIDPQSM